MGKLHTALSRIIAVEQAMEKALESPVKFAKKINSRVKKLEDIVDALTSRVDSLENPKK